MSMDRRQAKRLAAYVLAGGVSMRFGADKALAELGGKAMLARMLELARSGIAANDAALVWIIGDEKKYGRFAARCLADRWPGEGPLGGIATALLHTQGSATGCDWNLIVSCDMPFLTAEWLRFLVERATASEAQVVLAHSEHGPEPLCACWRTDAVETLQVAFGHGVRKVTDGIAQLRAEVLDEAVWKRFDNDGRLFWNMNTREDYEEARRVIEGRASSPPAKDSAR